MGKAVPDYVYLKDKLDISDKDSMIDALRRRAQSVDMKSLARDVVPFLADPSQQDRVLLFEQWLDTV